MENVGEAGRFRDESRKNQHQEDLIGEESSKNISLKDLPTRTCL